MRIKKKGERGNAANYISRSRAMKKLQLSLTAFRRLCILKGVYPRQPSSKKKASGNRNHNNTFYFTKDIKFLLHEPIVQKFREHRVFLRKLSKAIGKGDKATIQKIQDNEPKYSLNHILKERYPSFMDALRDLDDCLCHIFLFATLPQTGRIPIKAIEKSQKLASEFQNFIVTSKSLKKTFVSIKGVYYQAEVRGVTITWLVPHQFSVPIPRDVDLRVMLTFLEFYQCMLGFINYKLYSDLQLKYPPVLNQELDNDAGWLSAFVTQSIDNETEVEDKSKSIKKAEKKIKKRLQSILDEEKVVSTDIINASVAADKQEVIEDATLDQQNGKDEESNDESNDNEIETAIMSDVVVFISREVPRISVEFILRSMGAIVCYPETSGKGSPYPENSDKITYQIVDRPLESLKINPGRTYVQPQWVFDCLNANQKLSCDEYAPGKKLPPHLSPFKEYDPTHGEAELEGDLVDDEVEMDQKEREAEAVEPTSEQKKPDPVKPTKKVLSQQAKKKKEEAERVERAKMVMSNKKRKLYESIERKQQKDAIKKRTLAKKKKNIS